METKLRVPWLDGASPTRRWLVGVSGGADSVALLRLLVARGFRRLVVCHLNHGLRGREAAGDARFVRKLAAELNLPMEAASVRVRELARHQKESLETAARRARHEFFVHCARKFRCHRLILAHHADDQAETVLWNLLRGSHGAKGMKTVQIIAVPGAGKLEIHRPLLHLWRRELRAWLETNRWTWREDATNKQPMTVRNRLRHQALPLLADIAGREVSPALVRAAIAAEDFAEIEAWALGQAQVRDPQGRLHLGALRLLPPALQRAAIALFLHDAGVCGVDRDLLERALILLEPTGPARLNLPGNLWLGRREGRLTVSPQPAHPR
jgi:tRNA(Ile)-lysidine synthase